MFTTPKKYEEEMAHDVRRLDHADRVERQLQEFLTSLPFEPDNPQTHDPWVLL